MYFTKTILNFRSRLDLLLCFKVELYLNDVTTQLVKRYLDPLYCILRETAGLHLVKTSDRIFQKPHLIKKKTFKSLAIYEQNK